jgi:hypothetical protein
MYSQQEKDDPITKERLEKWRKLLQPPQLGNPIISQASVIYSKLPEFDDHHHKENH